VVEPLYLTESALDFPETLLETVRNETLHLYDNAFEILAHGLSLHREDIQSERDLEKLTSKSREVIAMDLDAIYGAKVKTLYAGILNFISTAQPNLPIKFSQKLHDLRDSNRAIVQSVKEVKHLRKNMSLYIPSANKDIRREYNKIRTELASVMRFLHHLRTNDGEDDVDLLDLDEFKLEIEENNIIVNGELDRLIRDGQITAAMGTSLMNDLGYARNVVWNLAEVAKSLYGKKDFDMRDAEELLALDAEEVEALASSANPENN